MTPGRLDVFARTPTPLIIVGSTLVLKNARVLGFGAGEPPKKLPLISLHTFLALRLSRYLLLGTAEAHCKLNSSRLITDYKDPPESRSTQQRSVPQPGLAGRDSHHAGISLQKYD